MSPETIPSLEGTRILPLFPLPVVLFPGAMLPLHIFEERYKRMMRECLDEEKVFGVSFAAEGEGGVPPVGRVGCAAFILAVIPLAEGRMNLLTTGLMRYRVRRYIDIKPYLEGEVEFFADDPTEDDLTALAAEVGELYRRTTRATRVLNNSDDSDEDLPESPEDLSFSVASSLQTKDDPKLELLETTDTRFRLHKLKTILRGVVGKYELRARVHEKAKTNGHGPHDILKQTGE